ncbi:sugar transferase [Adlercreutzia sp. ZJ141]|uniref:sugar transferase n=1 Tax=Adlercreutzia sp. ZJ141 TaxID=2709406 RepID=UPI0013EB967C|nr:sugar transferase [Adlercreutzia sp. ZJ141]
MSETAEQRNTDTQNGSKSSRSLFLEPLDCKVEGDSCGWPVSRTLSNREAAELLARSNAGIHPDLSRLGYRFVKRTFDIVASGVAIALLLLPSLALCIAICIKSPGASPLYGQTRVGRLNPDGSYCLFRMWKFRSMVPNADELLDGLKDQNEADGPLFKIKDDPRVIPGVGRFIRRHSLDELPQLVNVLLGDMSLIGPRPALPGEAVQYDTRAKRRLTVKAGCGGPWQAGSRSDGTFDEMIDLDLEYVESCSVGYDLKLIARTAKAMVYGDGAY